MRIVRFACQIGPVAVFTRDHVRTALLYVRWDD